MLRNDVLDLIMNRGSIRSYTDEEPSDEVIEAIVRAGQQAPFAGQLGSLLLSRNRGENPFGAPLLFTVCVDVNRLELVMRKRGWERATSDPAMPPWPSGAGMRNMRNERGPVLSTVRLGTFDVTRLICGGNPFSGISHVSAELDAEMLHYYAMPRLLACLDECWSRGINTFQSRGDRHQMRMYMEHRDGGGRMQWIAQTASEFADIAANIRQIAAFGPIAIYHHGTQTDKFWHAGRIDRAELTRQAVMMALLPWSS